MKDFQRFFPLFFLLILLTCFVLIIFKSIKSDNLNDDNQAIEVKSYSIENVKLQEFSVQSLFNEEENFSNQDLLNNKNRYSIINFFASWCSSCVKEHKYLLDLKKENIVDIYGVAWLDFRENAINFLAKNENPFIKTAFDSRGLFTKILGIKAVPETFVINNKGFVVLKIQGGLNQESVLEIKNFLNKNEKINIE